MFDSFEPERPKPRELKRLLTRPNTLCFISITSVVFGFLLSRVFVALILLMTCFWPFRRLQ